MTLRRRERVCRDGPTGRGVTHAKPDDGMHAAMTRRHVLTFRIDDLSGAATQALVAHHLKGMHASSPSEHVHALGVAALRDPRVTVWSAWRGGTLAGIGALKQLDGRRAELKSMRVADAFRGQGVGRAILFHILDEARARGIERVWLETGTGEAFVPAQTLYERAGFVRCGPFEGYTENAFSVFMTLDLAEWPAGAPAGVR